MSYLGVGGWTAQFILPLLAEGLALASGLPAFVPCITGYTLNERR